jgi:CheY-like chemotaxis protein
MLNDTHLNLRQKDWMETILASAGNLVNVVNMIASRAASTGLIDTKPASIAFNLQTLLNNTIQLFVGQSEGYNIGLKPNIDTTHILEGDPILIKQIFLTLIEAIIKNKKVEKINIIISYRVRQETERMFNATFDIRASGRLDFDLKNENADMLNYSISSKLIATQGNQLTVTYDQNYTIFNFTLPFKKATAEPKEYTTTLTEPDEIAPMSASQTVDLKEAKILLVEDNPINQKIVILSIQKLVKNIEVANNGQEALDKFIDTKYDIILMDIQMPVMDGIQATKKIRETEIDRRIVPTPIIAITANALAGDREHCLAAGMDEYISKPFQVEVLIGKMKTLLTAGSLSRR